MNVESNFTEFLLTEIMQLDLGIFKISSQKVAFLFWVIL